MARRQRQQKMQIMKEAPSYKHCERSGRATVPNEENTVNILQIVEAIESNKRSLALAVWSNHVVVLAISGCSRSVSTNHTARMAATAWWARNGHGGVVEVTRQKNIRLRAAGGGGRCA